MEKFNHVAEEMGLLDANGSSCYQHTNDSDDIFKDTNCSLVYNVCRELILDTQLTTVDCLAGNASTDGHEDEDGDDDDDSSYSEG